jgi:hypothetical protein
VIVARCPVIWQDHRLVSHLGHDAQQHAQREQQGEQQCRRSVTRAVVVFQREPPGSPPPGGAPAASSFLETLVTPAEFSGG